MAHATQNYRLFQLLKASTTCKKEVIAKELNVGLVSVPVYIHELKRLFKADIESVRVGRHVVAYRLKNKDIEVPQFRKGHTHKVKKTVTATSTTPVVDKDSDITKVSDREFADIRSSLGIDYGRTGSE
jgi:hypothetical protein